jgi:DNA-directed RNA polymerase subunit RPC12/RpoP
MAIVFHCEHCGKKVSAPDEAGGRQGKCPSCSQRVFIPMAKDQVEEIPLRQDNPEEKKRQAALKQEELRLQNFLLEHQDLPPEPGGPKARPESRTTPTAPTPVAATPIGIPDLVRLYMVHMAKGELEAAGTTAQRIISGGPKAFKAVEDLAMQEFIHPQLANIPQTVIAGFFKKLLTQFPK